MVLTIIIPSKKIRTIDSLRLCPSSYELVIATMDGVSNARNFGVKQGVGDLLVFFDDDLILQQKIWDQILSVRHGEFAMLESADLPCSRVVVIHRVDFLRIGGFDESIGFVGEDRVFYIKALKAGLKFKPISKFLVKHIAHKPRSGLPLQLESVRLFVEYKNDYNNMFKYYLVPLKAFQVRTVVCKVLFTMYFLVKNLRKQH